MTTVLTLLVIAAVYVAGVYFTAPAFTRRSLARHRAAYPSLWGEGYTESVRRECAAVGLVMGFLWPIAYPLLALTQRTYNVAYAEDLAAEQELERAKVYAQAREIIRKYDDEDRRRFDKELNS